MSPRRLMLLGTAVALGGLVVAALGAALPGPLNPECSGRPLAAGCRDAARLGGIALQVLGLGIILYGGTLVAIGLGRKWAADEEDSAG